MRTRLAAAGGGGGEEAQYRYLIHHRCVLCRKTKPFQQFRFVPTKGTNGGFSESCLDCEKKRKAAKARDARLLKQYGITTKQYDERLKAQKNRCAICKLDCSSGRKLAVDHDHATGEVRGLLCGKCNRAIGLMSDDIDRFIAAARYLHESRPDGR